jgi:hypothetical protein
MSNSAAPDSLHGPRRGHPAEKRASHLPCASLFRGLSFIWLTVLGALVFAGCASAPPPQMEDDLVAFAQGIDGILKVGMTYKEARTALRTRMPPTSIDTQVTAPVPSADRSKQMRRYMMGWPTFNTGTTLIVTIFCDREGKVVRWTTGPLTES